MAPSDVLPSSWLERLGVWQAGPQLLARASGWQRLMRAGLAREGAPVAQTPTLEVMQLGAARLLRYISAGPVRYSRPVLLCPSLINRHYILDLNQQISMVKMLLESGHDVYVIDWGDPGHEEMSMRLADFITTRLRPMIDEVCTYSGSDDVHVVGHCLGGTLATILAAVHDVRIASLVNLTVPIDFADDGMLSVWARMPFLDVRALTELFGHVPSWMSQPAFMLLRPMGQPVKLLRLYQNLGNENFLEFFRCMETWINDGVDVPRYFFVDLIEQLYRDNALVRGSMRIGGKIPALSNIRIPILTVCAQNDHIVSPVSALAGHESYRNDSKMAKVFAGGHLGVIVGGLARRNLWPLLTDWLNTHANENDQETKT